MEIVLKNVKLIYKQVVYVVIQQLHFVIQMNIVTILNNLQVLVFNNVINSKTIVFVDLQVIQNVFLQPIVHQNNQEFV